MIVAIYNNGDLNAPWYCCVCKRSVYQDYTINVRSMSMRAKMPRHTEDHSELCVTKELSK